MEIADIGAQYQLLRDSVGAMPDYVFVKDGALQYVAASDSYARQLGHTCAADILGKTDSEVMTDKEAAERFQRTDRRILATGENLIDAREELHNRGARIMYRSTCKYLIRDAQGNPVGILGKVQDITQDVIAEHRYEHEVRTLMNLGESDCYAAVIDLNERRLVQGRTNPAYGANLNGAMDLDTVIGNTLSCADDDHDDVTAFYNDFSFEYFSSLYRTGKDYFSFKYFHKLWNGRNLWMRDTVRIRINPRNSHLMALLSMQSIEDVKQRELELHRAAEMDGLTGLLNRNYAKNLIENVLAQSNEDATVYSMFMVDIDNFKRVNDSFGHQVGDQVLTNVAQALKSCFRESDIICRLGGDEFFAFVQRGSHSFTTSARAQKILERIHEKCSLGKDFSLTVSIGVCDYPKDGATLDALYASADKALYEAKKKGKNQFCIFDQIS